MCDLRQPLLASELTSHIEQRTPTAQLNSGPIDLDSAFTARYQKHIIFVLVGPVFTAEPQVIRELLHSACQQN
jgi:hypothetical protein